MDGEPCGEGSFGAKPGTGEQPDHTWGLDQLSEFLRAQLAVIDHYERQSAGSYWRLGQGLSLAYKQLGRSMRAPFLQKLGIHKVRASKSRAIYRRFPSIEAIGDLTIEQAYAERFRRVPSTQPSNVRSVRSVEQRDCESSAEVDQFLAEVAERTDNLARTAVLADQTRRMRWLAPTQLAIDRLERFKRLLQTDTPE